MPQVTLPDGKTLEVAPGTTVGQVAAMIGPGLAKAAVAGKVNGEIVDLSHPLEADCRLELLKLDAADPDSLYVLRHSAAHVMAEAICSLFPETKLVYGPPVDNGFYYDIDLDRPLSSQDFEAIEQRMAQIIKEDRPFTRYEVDRQEAFKKLQAEGNRYKIDNAERAEGPLSFYVTGPEPGRYFEDLCRGPHLPSTGRIGAFKVMQVSGAYYRGDQKEKQLQRVYGTAWPTRKDLDKYLAQLEEAKKRDHRKLGQELGLFTVDPLVGSGLVLWKPKGAVIRAQLEDFLRAELIKSGYQPVYTPHIGKLGLYRTSGHFPYYKDSQFPPIFESRTAEILNRLWEAARGRPSGEICPEERQILAELRQTDAAAYEALTGHSAYKAGGDKAAHLKAIEAQLEVSDGYLLKPMNCPHHIRIYASEPRSYRDLPIRLAEFGTVYRYEQSGELSGMTRVRGFTQDDAHLFCRPDQLLEEITGCVNLTRKVLDLLGLSDYSVRVSLRDPASDKYVGSAENWALAEQAVREAVKASGMVFTEALGEAAFYGPKIDFIVKDCIGREWQLGTVQVDYNLPERFELTYIGADNAAHQPVMIHRAPFGSMERFVGILIEHFAGAFPLWLAPLQVVVASVSEKSADYARTVRDRLFAAGVRVELDDSPEKIGPKKHNARKQKVPYILVVGEKEAAEQSVNVNDRNGRNLGNEDLAAFVERCTREIRERVL
ncbi:MAG TPA: threonine--tRNA ligase [Phycisphaerae bacterium]|nr:threonine--tRNA ligase [Phycisphaerae bacterium]HOB72922.1 threonine--tRNA ligase [Phycisphaerae bacterium]HOJ53029.1 threonine--tRNA ligase [Phycisphaerae bacterium]HOL24766.1 threonine--tRNA ligase [Phycisphaerae bacterium]HPP19302.1 threonine--tRNA ligase [Phycisphaerae bacterium]